MDSPTRSELRALAASAMEAATRERQLWTVDGSEEWADAYHEKLEASGMLAAACSPTTITALLDALDAAERLGEPRLLPEGVTECPTCGARTNLDAFILYSISRVLVWKAQRPDDAEANAVYDAAITEMRAELRATPHPEPADDAR